MDTAQTVFDCIVRAACGFESEYVREDAVNFSTARMRVLYMRVSIAAARPKKIPSGSFLHVSAGASRSARKPF